LLPESYLFAPSDSIPTESIKMTYLPNSRKKEVNNGIPRTRALFNDVLARESSVFDLNQGIATCFS
jgi:hypothetical protein